MSYLTAQVKEIEKELNGNEKALTLLGLLNRSLMDHLKFEGERYIVALNQLVKARDRIKELEDEIADLEATENAAEAYYEGRREARE